MRISDASKRYTDKMSQQITRDFTKASYQHALKLRDETFTPVDRLQLRDSHHLQLETPKARMYAGQGYGERYNSQGFDNRTMSFLTRREEADVRNTGHQREASRCVEQQYANALHTHIKELIKQRKPDEQIEAAAQEFRATYVHPINSSYCQAEALSHQGDQGTSSQHEEVQVLSDSDDDAPQASSQHGQGDQDAGISQVRDANQEIREKTAQEKHTEIRNLGSTYNTATKYVIYTSSTHYTSESFKRDCKEIYTYRKGHVKYPGKDVHKVYDTLERMRASYANPQSGYTSYDCADCESIGIVKKQ